MPLSNKLEIVKKITKLLRKLRNIAKVVLMGDCERLWCQHLQYIARWGQEMQGARGFVKSAKKARISQINEKKVSKEK